MKRLNILVIILFTGSSLIAQIGRELYRPVFHYTPSYNWMNDPNGLVYYNGKYHLFYQYNPSGMLSGNNAWGHATSTDLVRWEEQSIAIPVQNGVLAYSGSVVVDWKNTSGFGINGKPPLVAIYTGKSTVEDQRIAYSNDEGLTWTNYAGNPVLSLNNNQFRDPKVIWHEETKKWIMVVSQGSYRGLRFYSSLDLKNWTQLPGFAPTGNVSGFWECPDLFKLNIDNDSTNSKWVLVHSVTPTAQYFVGDFDGQRFDWSSTSPGGILFDDFEKNNYDDWTVIGNAFGYAPSNGSAPNSGYSGTRLANSLQSGSGGQGKLLSPPFTVTKKYLSFLIGGGYNPSKTYIKLVANGQAVRTSTGMNEGLMKWRNWDVSSFAGQILHIEIVDSATGRWGYITVDHIIQSDTIVDDVNTGQVDYGRDFYAVQSFSDIPATDGRRIWLSWLGNWLYAQNTPTTPWRGMMSLPRELKLEKRNGQIKLIQQPVKELTMFRKDSFSFLNTKLSTINNSLRNVTGSFQNIPSFKQFELKAKIAVGNKTGFSLKFKKHGLQYSEYIFDFINKEIRFDRSKSGALTNDQNFADIQVAPLIIENGFFDIHLFVDNSSTELFTANGQVVMSNQIYPDSISNKIELSELNEDMLFEELKIWKLDKNITLPPESVVVHSNLFSVYPNPVISTNGTTLKIKNEFVGQVVFKIFDMNGKLISEFQPSSNSLILPINKLPKSKGLYLLVGSNGEITQTEKLLVTAY